MIAARMIPTMKTTNLVARVRIDPYDPVARRDLLLQLIALLRLRELPTAAARRRAYRRIPKGWGRVVGREMGQLIDDMLRVR
jgi:hypothetical protein